jgi:hypothetical protein
VALTVNDVVMVTTQGVRSIADNRVRNAIFTSLSAGDRHKAFLYFNSSRSEVWIAFPTNSSSYCDKAFVWNTLEDKWQVRSLPGLAYALSMPSQDLSGTIDGDSGDFDGDDGSIDSAIEASGQVVGVPYTNTKLFVFGSSNTDNGMPMTASVAHHSYDFADQQGAGPDKIKLITRIRPHVAPTTAVGTELLISIGTQLELAEAIEWSSPRSILVGTTRDVYFRSNGRYISWKVESDSDCSWSLEGLDIEYRVGGVY